MLKRNVLIFHSAALGDFVLTWPLALAASRLFPQSRIIYITQKSKGQLAERLLHVEFIDSETGWHTLFSSPPVLAENLRRVIDNAHTIFTFTIPPENLERFAPDARIIPLSTKPPIENGGTIHITQQTIEQLKDCPAIAEAVKQILSSIRANGVSAKPRFDVTHHGQAADADLLIHPGSGSREKCWELANFLEIAKHGIAQNKTIRFIIGEAERERFSKNDLTVMRAIAEVHEPQTYLDLATELQKTKSYLGNDSGPTHLAAILGIKTLAIFRSTNPAIWSPLGPRVVTVQADEITPVSLLKLL